MPKGKWFSLSAVLRLLHVSEAETAEEIAIPAFMNRPGMGGTTIARPDPIEILRAIYAGGATHIRLDDAKQGVTGTWVIDPETCEINDEGTQITLMAGTRPIVVPIEGMSECGAASFAHTLFEVPMDGTGLEGHKCFRSTQREDGPPRRIILVFPKAEGLP